MTMPQSRPMHEGSIPTSKTPKISFSCGLDIKETRINAANSVFMRVFLFYKKLKNVSNNAKISLKTHILE